MSSSWARVIERVEDVSITGDGVDRDDVSVTGDVELLMSTSFDVSHAFLAQPEARTCRSRI